MRTAILTSLMFAIGCQAPFGVEDAELPLLRTSSGLYQVEVTTAWASLRVPYEFSNDTDRTVYVGGCNGVIAPLFERRVGDEWEGAYQAPTLSCWSPPRAISAGTTVAETAELSWRVTPDTTASGRYQPGTVAGRYRLRWIHATLASFSGSGPSDSHSLPLELSVSNPFDIAEPPNGRD